MSSVLPVGVTGYNDFTYLTLGGAHTPGTILSRGGIQGFKRKTGWDIRHGKGNVGATLVRTMVPPVEGTVILQLLDDADLRAWHSFVVSVLSTDPTIQAAKGISIYYPLFFEIDLTAVVVRDYWGPQHQGKGLYHAGFELVEWLRPPSKSIVSTVTSTVPTITIVGEDPEVASLQQQVADEQAKKKAAQQAAIAAGAKP